uniref:Uncharacterized protein n=1 Tax=Rhizophora mucronata TaxID=61149 RepID=A0A2P2PTK9_RHIMU
MSEHQQSTVYCTIAIIGIS